MSQEQIQTFHQWNSGNDDDLSSIIGASRQLAHLAGVLLDPRGRWKKDGQVSTLKFSIRPRPLKWKGFNEWKRIMLVIKKDVDDLSFCVMIDGVPMRVSPTSTWSPLKRAREVIEKATKKLNRS